MAREYPRVSQREKASKGKCELCGFIPAGRVVVEINSFRGDDGVHKVCADCQKQYSNDELLTILGYVQKTNVED